MRRPFLFLFPLTACVIAGCDPVHHIAIKAVPTRPLNGGCVAGALAPIGGTMSTSRNARPQLVLLYSIPVGESGILVNVPVADGGVHSAVELSWSTIGSPEAGHVEDIRRTMERAYNAVRDACGGLPTLEQAEHECWHRGCRR
jgi:hypothetical protein